MCISSKTSSLNAHLQVKLKNGGLELIVTCLAFFFFTKGGWIKLDINTAGICM